MKRSLTCVALVLMNLFIFTVASYASFQTGSGGIRRGVTPESAPPPSAPPRGRQPSMPPSTGPPAATRRDPPPATRSTASTSLTISTNMPGCAVSLVPVGQARGARAHRGMTNQNGLYNLPTLRPGTYRLVVSRADYNQEQMTFQVNPGQSNFVPVALRPILGTLSVAVNVAGAEIQIAGVNYANSVDRLELAPNRYQVTVSRPGYRTRTQDVEVSARQHANLNLTLEPVPVEETMNQAIADYGARRFAPAIAAARTVLAAQPDHPQANALMGRSLYDNRDYAGSLDYLLRALTLGERIEIPIRRHRNTDITRLYSRLNEEAVLVLGGGRLEYRSLAAPNENFDIPAGRIHEIKPELHRGGRIHLEVYVPRPGSQRERKRDYNIHVWSATTRELTPNDNVPNQIIVCDQACHAEFEVLHRLLVQLRQMATTSGGIPSQNRLR